MRAEERRGQERRVEEWRGVECRGAESSIGEEREESPLSVGGPEYEWRVARGYPLPHVSRLCFRVGGSHRNFVTET